MKKLYFTSVLLIATCLSFAQTQKGTVNINGLFGTNTGGLGSNSPSFKNSSLHLNPNIGYFVKDNWEVGSGVLFGFNQSKYSNVLPGNPTKISNNQFGVNAYSKYYFGLGNVRPYLAINAGYSWIENKTIYVGGSTDTYNINNWNTGAGVGATWFVSKRVGLFSQLTYDRRWAKYSSTGALNLNFGVQVNLGKQK